MRRPAKELSDVQLLNSVGAEDPEALTIVALVIRDGRRDVAERLDALGISGWRVAFTYNDLGDGTLPTLYETVGSGNLLVKFAALGY